MHCVWRTIPNTSRISPSLLDFFAQFACPPLLLMRVCEATFIHRILKFHDININKNRTWLCFLYLRWYYGTYGKRLASFTIFHLVFFSGKSCNFVWNCWLNYTFLFSILLALACRILVFFVTKKIVFAAEATRIEMKGSMCSLQFYKYDEPILTKHYVGCLVFKGDNRRRERRKSIVRMRENDRLKKYITRSLFSIIVMIFICIYCMQPARV